MCCENPFKKNCHLQFKSFKDVCELWTALLKDQKIPVVDFNKQSAWLITVNLADFFLCFFISISYSCQGHLGFIVVKKKNQGNPFKGKYCWILDIHSSLQYQKART